MSGGSGDAGGDAKAVAKLVVEYDGSPFAGWAEQPGERSVAGELRRALGVVLRADPPPALEVAGRTDRGVHALGQVVSYAGPPPALRSVNALLPPAIAVRSAEVAPPGFSARHDAVARAYRYRVHARRAPSPFARDRALWWPHRVDFAALAECARALVGTHDFTAFTPSQSLHRHFRRTITRAAWTRGEDGWLEFSVEADSFLRHMNRVLVATMLDVAGARRSPAAFRALLAGAPRARAGVTAPAHGLYLEQVRYG